MKKLFLTLALCLTALVSNAKSEDIPLFPRTFGYSTKGNAETKTITFEKGYARYGYKNKGKIDLTAYTKICLEIEPTDSRVELQVVYINDGEEERVKLGQINKGQEKIVVEYDGMREIAAFYLTKSQPGEVVVKNFYLTDEE